MTVRRVAVSGVGAICALGPDRDALWRAVAAGRSAIGPLTLLRDEESAALRSGGIGAEIPGFDAGEHFDPKTAGLLDRFAQFLVVAAREAMADAGIERDDPRLAGRTAIVTGSGIGGQQTQDEIYRRLYGEGRSSVHPWAIPKVMANAGASQLAIELGSTGPAFTLATACSSSAHAIGLGFWLLRQGVVDLAVVGGSEAPFCYGHLKAWESLRALAPDTCRPFSRDRQGMVLGEGGAVLVLEPLDAALARGARPHAELAGFGMSADAHHLTQPHAPGAAAALRAALADAGMEPEEVGYVNAHGTGTPANDPSETRAVREVFGGHAERLAMSSTKSMHGHTLGAAGALEATVTVLALAHGLLPPTANYTTPDPECDLDVVPNQARAATVGAALSSSFAFGGLNAVLAFRALAG